MTTQIPEEYLSFDFGFSAVDETELVKRSTVTTDTVEAPAMSEDLKRIEDKIQSLTSLMFSLEDKLGENISDAAMKDKIRQLEAIIIPLLNNLLKTADKEYIYWPNRKDTIEKQIQKVLSITRG